MANNDLQLDNDIPLLRVLAALATNLSGKTDDELQTLKLSPLQLSKMLSNPFAGKVQTSTSSSSTVNTWSEAHDTYTQFVGKPVFVRNGIFAYCGHVVSNHKDVLVLRDVVWFADTGEYQQLMTLPPKKHLDTLSSAKPQWYLPGRYVIATKSLFSDVHEFQGDFSPPKRVNSRCKDMDNWDVTVNPYDNLVDQQIFIRNGIFAYSAKLLEVKQNALVCNNVCWYADTGDYEVLLNTPSKTHISSLSGCKPQWYPPDAKVVFETSLFSDVFRFDADTTFK